MRAVTADDITAVLIGGGWHKVERINGDQDSSFSFFPFRTGRGKSDEVPGFRFIAKRQGDLDVTLGFEWVSGPITSVEAVKYRVEKKRR
jgi:hypothetical protein